jgi:hypothetical protein
MEIWRPLPTGRWPPPPPPRLRPRQVGLGVTTAASSTGDVDSALNSCVGHPPRCLDSTGSRHCRRRELDHHGRRIRRALAHFRTRVPPWLFSSRPRARSPRVRRLAPVPRLSARPLRLLVPEIQPLPLFAPPPNGGHTKRFCCHGLAREERTRRRREGGDRARGAFIGRDEHWFRVSVFFF